uniref:Uncharacterized protein n=1 Tax=Setaria italica TaxID=4555 RepID=K4AI14_SETIT
MKTFFHLVIAWDVKPICNNQKDKAQTSDIIHVQCSSKKWPNAKRCGKLF